MHRSIVIRIAAVLLAGALAACADAQTARGQTSAPAVAGGGKGAGVGAGIGGTIGALADLAANCARWDDFTLKQGREAWLRLDDDFTPTASPSEAAERPQIKIAWTSPQLPQEPTAQPLSPAPAGREGSGAVYLEPLSSVRSYRVNRGALLRALNRADVPLARTLSEAAFRLRVWRDSRGLHGLITDQSGAIVWAESPFTLSGLARGVARYTRSYGLTPTGASDVHSAPPAFKVPASRRSSGHVHSSEAAPTPAGARVYQPGGDVKPLYSSSRLVTQEVLSLR